MDKTQNIKKIVLPGIETMNKITTNPEHFVLSVQDLSAWYGTAQVLKNISFNIQRHQVTAIIGPSGCGKSTLIRCFNRMNDFMPVFRTTGSILLEGQDLYSSNIDPVEVRLKIGMVFQKQNPFPKSIYENVVYGPRVLGIKNKKKLDQVVEDSLKRAALWDEVNHKLKSNALSLSGGQQQRLCIARALANEPEVLLLDEPCSALDPIATAKIEELIQELKRNYTIVIVTHNMQQAARVSDYTAYLLLGSLIEFGETKAVFTTPSRKETEDYITGRFG
ncbi:MAG: phosphate ABC transporter ATP-binding protein [Omnitrophica bacterium RIFCSPHIGHO2_02_FULL_46_11]|nr:MAG: phosphate ABC transporter ATP-binding protein [Omnitrophica bacterium RIFCSPHIGHO2_02_FULL_46_11]OGW87754.1 MAG: phosphate ABC transporter ATP-binding protein [Omnitrophica bacterium RIFCSPLOWO2_01_FULL_45_10b]